MTTYSAITAPEIAQDAPVTQPLMQKVRDNPIAQSEGATGAPIVRTGWHPYNSLAYGDGNDGLFYDQTVHGTVASIVTPDFVDGYEYRVRFERVSGSAIATFNIELYRETDALYGASAALYSLPAASGEFSGFIELPTVRLSVRGHPSIGLIAATSSTGASGISPIGSMCVQSSQKRTRARFAFSSGNIDAGKMWLDRRLVTFG